MSRASSMASRGFRIAGRVVKAVALGLVFGVIIFLLWRIFSADTPKALKALTPNEKLSAAYEKYRDELYIFKQDGQSITTANHNRGYYSITECEIIPDADQIQIVFRYNNSTIEKIAKDKELSETPKRDTLLFDLSLYVHTDLTPENKNDNYEKVTDSSGNEILVPTENVKSTRIQPYGEAIRENKNFYNYYRYVFDFSEAGLSLSELIDNGELLSVYTDIYYVGDVNYEQSADGTLLIYYHASENVDVKLSSASKKAIKEFAGK